MNTNIKNFKIKMHSVLNEQMLSMKLQEEKSISLINTINFEVFSNKSQYTLSYTNKIFFTYNNHYSGNLGTDMEVNSLRHPHVNYEDRGYIRGVSTDLDGYLKLRNMPVSHNISIIGNIYMPKFNKSKHSDKYKIECLSILSDCIKQLDEYKLNLDANINSVLRKATGCSLLHYLRTI